MTKKTAVRINLFKKLWTIIKIKMGFNANVIPIITPVSDETTVYYKRCINPKGYCKHSIKPFEEKPITSNKFKDEFKRKKYQDEHEHEYDVYYEFRNGDQHNYSIQGEAHSSGYLNNPLSQLAEDLDIASYSSIKPDNC